VRGFLRDALVVMPNVDHARRELRLKLVYYGPGLGGKTTNLENIHRRSRPDMRGKLVTLNDATERTLFFDLLPMELGTFKGYAVRLHLCTVPGQIAHDRVRQLVLRNVDGIVMVVDSQRQRLFDNLESIRNLQTNLRLQGEDPARLPMVVQYNKRDVPSAMAVETLRELLGVPKDVRQIEAVARVGYGVLETLKAILKASLALVENPAEAPSGRSPSILPGRHVSMFPDAVPPALERRRQVSAPAPRFDIDNVGQVPDQPERPAMRPPRPTYRSG
jgi:signal recognition particle receptor subunit beta